MGTGSTETATTARAEARRSSGVSRLLVGRGRADHRRPRADVPALDQPIDDIGIGRGEAFGDRGVGRVEQQHRAVDRIGERAAEDQLAARDRGFGVGEVRAAKVGTAREIVVRDIVEEQPVRHVSRRTAAPASRAAS